jgi:hypothetical protein
MNFRESDSPGNADLIIEDGACLMSLLVCGDALKSKQPLKCSTLPASFVLAPRQDGVEYVAVC